MERDRDVLLIGYTSEIHLVLIGSEIEAGIRPEDGAVYRAGTAADAGAGNARQIVHKGEDQRVVPGATPAFNSTCSGERQWNVERERDAAVGHPRYDASRRQRAY